MGRSTIPQAHLIKEMKFKTESYITVNMVIHISEYESYPSSPKNVSQYTSPGFVPFYKTTSRVQIYT